MVLSHQKIEIAKCRAASAHAKSKLMKNIKLKQGLCETDAKRKSELVKEMSRYVRAKDGIAA